jgi:ketopantoate reductase
VKIVFLGAGALGNALGSKLTQAGNEVHLVGVFAAHAEAMRLGGLPVREASGEKVVRVQASTDCRGIGSADLVVVLLKSFHTRQAIEGVAPIEVEACALAAVAEGIAVAGALGVKRSSRVREARVKASAGLPAEFKTSMLQNLEKGSPTEIDFINGAVVRRGDQVGLPTPVNRTLVACVKDIERGLQA